ncbi:hypothetical protein PV08_07091 [Exophiala spinifera]|uniref:Uncharacterized protein n=1 Tax=Exophiala spinifera TaxID=91928 RepID=A0A0D2BSQ3_9EURO|nr:uncharacterized protein PV08_07091 [Exophiala spinifera]KIW14309.1 hypothetical protein PV08_07091 [Exophiala spinifera]
MSDDRPAGRPHPIQRMMATRPPDIPVEERRALENMYLHYYPANHNRITSRFLVNPPRHLLDQHTLFPVEPAEHPEELVEDLLNLSRFPSTADGFRISFAPGTRRPALVTYPSTLSWLIWGISDSLHLHPIYAYYYFAKWTMIDGWNSQEFRSEFQAIEYAVELLLEFALGERDPVRIFSIKLLLQTFRIRELDICGCKVKGKIIHWAQDPKQKTLPHVVIFQASNPQMSLYALTKTRFQDNEEWPVAQLVGTDLTWEYAEDIGTTEERARRLTTEEYVNPHNPLGPPWVNRSSGEEDDASQSGADGDSDSDDHSMDLSVGNPTLLGDVEVVLDHLGTPEHASSSSGDSESDQDFRAFDYLDDDSDSDLPPWLIRR